MARMKFLCDAERCIECNACVTACKNEHDVPWGINRRHVVTLNDGEAGRKIDLRGLHALHGRAVRGRLSGGLLLHDTRRHGAARQGPVHRLRLLLLRLSVRRAAISRREAFGSRGKMDKCTFCAGGPEPDGSEEEYKKYGRNRIAEGKLPLCAEMCSTKALLGGDGNVVSEIYIQRVTKRGGRPKTWGWETAYNFKPGKEE